MKNTMNIFRFIPLLLAFGIAMGLGSFLHAQKKVIERADQLPRRSYTVKETDFLKAIQDRKLVDKLAAELEENLLNDLEKYEITDAATLKGYYSQLQALSIRKLDFKKAIEYSRLQKELADKDAEKLLTGSGLKAYYRAYKEVGQDTGDEFEAKYQTYLYEVYASLPYEKIEEDLLASKASLEVTTKDLIVGSIKAQLQPVIDKMGKKWSEGVIATLISYENLFNKSIHLLDERLAVINQLVEENAGDKAEQIDIWASRTVDFPAESAKNLNTVVIGVWDTGVDMDVFSPENRYTNAKEKLDGKDNDGNGFVDDLHGIAFDKESNRSAEPLLPATNLRYEVAQLEALSSGFFDLQVNLQSEDADKFKKFMRELKQEDMQGFFEDIGWYGVYAHGTHVAGIAQQGNPAAQIIASRLEYSTSTIPAIPTKEKAKRTADMYTSTIKYFQQQGVRVVNMSWRYNQMAYEGALAANGIGKTPEERAKIAAELFQIEKTALHEAMKNAPEILFVCGSGNENNDADFAEYIPAGLNLPNLITIGAVDIEGKKTSFTTEGESVDFYANGHKIESFVPGGNRLYFSGTSMASPQVVNLAGKLWAINPGLSVAEVISLIDQGCDTSEEGIKRINPKVSAQLLVQQLTKANAGGR